MLRNFVTATVRITRSSRLKATAARQTSFSDSDNSTTDAESSSEEEGFVDLKTLAAQSDLPTEFWWVTITHEPSQSSVLGEGNTFFLIGGGKKKEIKMCKFFLVKFVKVSRTAQKEMTVRKMLACSGGSL